MRWAFLLIGLSIFTQGIAQQDSIRWSRFIEDSRKSNVEYLLLANDSTLLLARTRFARFMGPEVPFLEQYRLPSFELGYSKPLIMPVVNGRETDFETLQQLNGKLYTFVRYHSRPDARYRMYAQYLTPEGDTEDRPVLLDEQLLDEGRRTGSYRLVFSDSANYAALVYVPPSNRNQTQALVVKVFDADLRTIWSQALELPYEEEAIEIGKPVVDELGNVFVPAKLTNLKRNWTAGKPNYHHFVLGCFPQQGQVREFEVKLPSERERVELRSVSSLLIKAMPDKRVMVAGLYSNLAQSRAQSDGLFYLSIDSQTGTVGRTAIIDFTEQVKRPFLSERQLERNLELDELQITDVLPIDGGALMLLAEQRYVRQRCITDPRTGASNCTDHFYFNDLLALMIEPDGKTISSVRIPKSQHSSEDGGPYSSYAVATDGALPVFFFNDHQRNITNSQTESPRTMQNPFTAVLARVELSRGSDPIKKSALASGWPSLVAVPKQQLRFSDGRVLIYGVAKKGYRFTVLSGR